MADETRLYKVFNVGEWNVVLPEGSSFGFLSRLTGIGSGGIGNRITDIVDTNENGRPDSGDTVITSWGDRIDNVRLNGDEIKWPSSYDIEATGGWVNSIPLKGSSLTYTVKQLESTGLATLAKDFAGVGDEYIQQREEEAQRIGRSISDNPAVVGVMASATMLLSLHPWGRIALEALGMVGAAAGTGYMIYDRLSGAINGTPMAEHDLSAMMAMAGGSASLRGMEVRGFITAPIRALEGILPKIGGGGTGLIPVYATAGSTGIAIDGAIASEAGATAAVSAPWIGGIFPGIMTISALPAVPVFSENGRALAIDTQFFPEVASWKGTDAGRAAEEIEAFMDLEGSGNRETVLKQIQSLKEIYTRAPKDRDGDKIRQLITEALKEIQAQIDGSLTRSSGTNTELSSIADTASQQISQKLAATVKEAKAIIKVEGGQVIDFVSVMKKAKAASEIKVPENVVLDKEVLEQAQDPKLASLIQRAVDKITAPTNGNKMPIYVPGVKWEIRLNDGPGYRAYFGIKDGKYRLLKFGIKKDQDHDLAIAATRAAELGLSLFLINLGMEAVDPAAAKE